MFILSKGYSSHNFHLISTKLYGNYGIRGDTGNYGIRGDTGNYFLDGNCQILKIYGTFEDKYLSCIAISHEPTLYIDFIWQTIKQITKAPGPLAKSI